MLGTDITISSLKYVQSVHNIGGGNLLALAKTLFSHTKNLVYLTKKITTKSHFPTTTK